MESSSFKRSWHYILLWIIVAGMLVVKVTEIFKQEQTRENRAVMLLWTPADTVRYAAAFKELHNLFIKHDGGWTRTKVNGAWQEPQSQNIYAEDGFFYVISLVTMEPQNVSARKKEIHDLVTRPENKSGFNQKESYVELLHAANRGTHTPLFE